MICTAPYCKMTENISAGDLQNCWSIPVTQWSLLHVLSFLNFKSFYYLINAVFSGKKLTVVHWGHLMASPLSFYSTQTWKMVLWRPLMDILAMTANTSSNNSKGQTTVIGRRTRDQGVAFLCRLPLMKVVSNHGCLHRIPDFDTIHQRLRSAVFNHVTIFPRSLNKYHATFAAVIVEISGIITSTIIKCHYLQIISWVSWLKLL